VETVSGPVKFNQIKGSQTYVTGGGAIEGQSSTGPVEFRSRGGEVRLTEVSGAVSGHTDSGAIRFGVTEWFPSNRAALETDTASVEVHLPYHFSSWVDFWAQEGKVDSDVEVKPVEVSKRLKKAEPAVGQRTRGVCGSPPGGERLAPFGREADIRVLSRRGNILVRRSGEISSRDLLNHDSQSDNKSENSSNRK
jgi:hypothetical protein